MYLRAMRATERETGTMSIDAFSVEAALPPTTTVRRTGGWVAPFLLVNVWKGEYQSSLGAEQLTNDCAAFMKESLKEDLRRGARYALVEQGGDLRVDVKVTKIEMSAPSWKGATSCSSWSPRRGRSGSGQGRWTSWWRERPWRGEGSRSC
jgi:hypothetical protein